MLANTALRFAVVLLIVFLNFLLQLSANASLNLIFKHHHNHQSCQVNKPNKDCVFKSIALPVDLFDDSSINQTFTLSQHVPGINQTGFAWINWQGEKGLLPVLSELAQNNPSQSYHNPFDQKDKIPQVNDWMYSASVSDLENIDIAIKFKLFHKNKQVWVPLWKAQSTLQEEQQYGLDKILGWFKNKTCQIGLVNCEDRLIYQIGGYAVVDIIDVGINFQNGKKLPWIKVVFKGFKHCFNAPPTAQGMMLSGHEDQALALKLPGSDADNNPLTYLVSTPPEYGKLEGVAPDLVYIPNADFAGVDEFYYTVSDGTESTTAKVTITLKPVNDAPVAQNQSLTTTEDQILDLILQGTDVDSSSLSYTFDSQPIHGKLVLANGQYQYVPDSNFAGEDSFKFIVSDGELSSVGLVRIMVHPVNDAPVAQPLNIQTLEDTSIDFRLQGIDPDGDVLGYAIQVQPQHGQLVGSGQNLKYIPNPNYAGVDEFSYLVSDGQLSSNSVVRVAVVPVNDAPQAKQQNLVFDEDTNFEISLYGSDDDSTDLTFTIVQQPQHGHLEGNGKEIRYVPDANYHGEDYFAYEVSDGEASATAEIRLVIRPVNDAPLVEDQTVITPEDVKLRLNMHAQDVDNDELSYQIIKNPEYGRLEKIDDQYFYSPDANFSGTDSLVYQVDDGTYSRSATITIQVTPVNDAPTADSKSVAVKASGDVTILLTGTDIEGDELGFRVVEQPRHGQLVVSGDLVKYVPHPGYEGADSFRYASSDGELDSLPATVSIQVIRADNRGRDFWLTFLANISKPDGLKVFIASDVDGLAYIEVAGLNYKKEVVLQANKVATVDLLELYDRIVALDASKRQEFLSSTGMHVYSEHLISVYALNQLKNTTDAAAILPTEYLGKSYFVTNYEGWAHSEIMAFVATEDNTTVEIFRTRGQAFNDGRAPRYNDSYFVTLNRGQAYHINSTMGQSNIAGSRIESNKPVAFFSGDVCTLVPNGWGHCDHLYEQGVPVEHWSTDYMTSPLATRKKGDTFRIYAAHHNTQVFLNRRPLVNMDAGAFYEVRLESAALIQATKPVFVNQFSHGSTFDNVVSDPFMVGLPAKEQYLSSYVFTTPATGFSKNFINVIATEEAIATLILDGVKPQVAWQKIPFTNYQYAQIPVALGAHRIKSDGVFGLTVYGYDKDDSYGYTGGLNLSPHTLVPVAAPLFSTIMEDVPTAMDGLPLDAAIISQPGKGKLTLENGRYIYTPNQNYIGKDDFLYEYHDGSQVRKDVFNLEVLPVNDAPVFDAFSVSFPEGLQRNYFDLPKKDMDGDTVSYKLIKPPLSNAQILQTGGGNSDKYVYNYQQNNADFNGQDEAVFEVTDGKLKSTITVIFNVLPVNDAPVAQPLNLKTDEDIVLPLMLQGVDVDNDTLSYSIIKPPGFGTLAGQGQHYSYTPNANFNGVDTFEYEVSDGVLVSRATVIISVNAVNDAPVAVSQSVQVRKNKTGYIVLSASDIDNTGLVYQLAKLPMHGTITGTAPNLVYIPHATYEGEDEFQFTVSDGTLSHTGVVNIAVVDTPNRLPVWQSIPPATAEVGEAYQYTLQASDPDQDPITYSLTMAAPQGVSIHANLLSWIPQDGQEGAVEFQVLATDAEGGFTAQTIKLTVQPRNVAPVIQSQPTYNATSGKPYHYQVVASDANQDKLGYSMENAPSGMKIDPVTGLITWDAAVEGQYNLVLKVGDGRWVVSQSYTLKVAPSQPLSLAIVAPAQVKQNESFVIKAVVGGAGSNTTVKLWVDGVEVALDNNYQNTAIFTTTGNHILSVTAQDGTEIQTKTASVWVTDASDTTPALVTLTGLDNLQTITQLTRVTGQIFDSNNTHWTVSLYDADSVGSTSSTAIWTKDGQGNINGELAVIDPTLLVNGVYTLVVHVVDAGGNVTELVRDIIIDGKMKVGELAFTLEDAVIAMPALDISLQRSYDSRMGHRVGDFGHAWTLGIQQLQMRQSRPVHTGWETYMSNIMLQTAGTQVGTICLRQVAGRPLPTVTVTLPDGDVETFQVELGCTSGIRNRTNGEIIQGNTFPVTFKAIGDTQSTFKVSEQATVSIINSRWSYSSEQDIDGDGNPVYLWYVPKEFSIKTQDQTTYYFNKTQGITKVTEPTGHTLIVNAGGIFHSAGTSIRFVRDGVGRITSTTLPDNTVWQYEYNGVGDLVKAIAPDNVENLYVYDNNHRLLKITDKNAVLLAGYEYDADGRLIAMLDAKGQRIELTHQLEQNTEQVKDRLGRVTTYTYDDYGNITHEVNPLGHVTLRTFNTTYDQLTETDPLGRMTSWTYDAKHNKLTETNHLGQTTSYSYDSYGKLLTETDHLGRVVSNNSYDDQGQLTQIKNAAGQITGMRYVASGLASLTDAAGNTTAYVYTGDNLTETTDPTGRKVRYSYDANKRKLTETVIYTDAQGIELQLLAKFEYDSKGRLVKQTNPDGTTTSKTYGSADELLTETNAFGQVTSYIYDANKQLVQTIHPDGTISKTVYDAEGQVLQQTDRLGRITQYEYDLAGRKVKTVLPNGAILSTTYDAVGNILSESNALGQSTSYEYDALNRKIKTTDSLNHSYVIAYDALGRVATETDALGQVSSHEYNDLNQRTKTTYANGNTRHVVYNPLGQKAEVIDELGRSTQFAYDAGGRLITVTDPLGYVTTYTYDMAGHKTSQKDALGRITRWEYDALGREISRSLPLGQTEQRHYNSYGQLIQLTDFNGQSTSYSYDSEQRLQQTLFADGKTESFVYDAEGQLLQGTQSQGNQQLTSSYQYDAAGNLLQETQPGGSVLQYSYDLAGNKLQVTAISNGLEKVTRYGYDALNRLITVTDHLGTTTTTYNAVGNRLTESRANGMTTGYAYDARNRLTGMSHINRDGQVVASFAYVLDAAGQRLSMLEHSGRMTGWAYDNTGKLIAESVQQSGYANRDSSYVYDAVGNRLEQTVAGVKTTYGYDANDRLSTENKAGLITDYSYDNQGNTVTETRQGQVTRHSYNAEHELVQSTKAGMNASYNYNLNGIRTEQTVNGISTHYLNDNNMPYAAVLMEIQNQQPVTTYTYGDDLISYHQGTGSQYYLYDGLGSTRALTGTNGQVTDQYTYDAYGQTIEHTGTSNNRYEYAGEQKDITGNYYLRARYYNPSVGRFTQMDTYMGQNGNPVTLHKYLYANASPTMYTDPSGHMSLGGLSFSFSGIGYATAARTTVSNMGPRLINSLVKPVAASKRVNAMPSFTNLLYRVVDNFCLKGTKRKTISDKCKPDIGLIVYGAPHDELTEHISDAYWTLDYPQVILTYRGKNNSHDRGWLNNHKGIGKVCEGTTLENNKDCDEYPFASTEQGGEANFNKGNVSLRGVNSSINKSGGGLLLQLYARGGVSAGDNFIVLASTSVPISFVVGSNGYMTYLPK